MVALEVMHLILELLWTSGSIFSALHTAISSFDFIFSIPISVADSE